MKQEKKTALADCQSKLVSIKEENSLSNHDLSILTGIAEPAIQSILNGQGNLDADMMRKLSRWLNTPTKIEYFPHGKRIAVLMPENDIHSWLLIPLSYKHTAESWKLATR